MLINLAERYDWTPQQVAEMDPDFLDEVDVRLRAEADHEALRKRRRRAEAARAQQERAAAKAGWVRENVGIEDIT